jgi:hypothetical protein
MKRFMQTAAALLLPAAASAAARRGIRANRRSTPCIDRGPGDRPGQKRGAVERVD